MKDRKDSPKVNRKKLIGFLIILVLLVLCIAIAITWSWLGDRLGIVTPDNTDVIALIPEEEELTDDTGELIQISDMETEPQVDMRISDGKIVWKTKTEVDLFHISYTNGEGRVVVKSGNGDKVIAPGTENSYSFKLKNTGNVPVEYTVSLEAYMTPAELMVPVEGRMRQGGKRWLAGSEESWADILELHAIQDQRSLHVNRYDSYTLDWRWPFESGDDAYDTWLGNQAAKSGVTMTLVIKTTAIMDQKAMEQDAMGENGIWQGGVPQTGDNSRIVLYMLLGGSSFLVLLALWCLIARKKKDYQEESHEEDNKGYQYRRKPGEKRE